jgi:hypothetical protein
MIIEYTGKTCSNCIKKDCFNHNSDYRLHTMEDACWVGKETKEDISNKPAITVDDLA